MTKILPGAVRTHWSRTVWQGEPAWLSVRGAVRAVISETRARLTYFGAADGSLNLLYAPVLGSADDGAPNPPDRGGHRFWLGPQRRWCWPPPPDWEYSPAQDASTDGTVLTLRLPHTDARYPALTRTYHWDDHRLRCTVSWPDAGGEPWFGLQVIAVETPFVVKVGLHRAPAAPAGFVRAEMIDPPEPIEATPPAVTVSGEHAIVRAGSQIAKFGFPPQPLEIKRPRGWTLALRSGPPTGTIPAYPDHGYLSQVWVGDARHGLAELEQLSPYLRGDATGRCASTIELEATPPGS